MLADSMFLIAMTLVVIAGFSAIRPSLASKPVTKNVSVKRARPYRARRVTRPAVVVQAEVRPPWEQFYV